MLFNGVADAILVADADRRYLDANPAALRLLGYSRDELLRLRVDDVVAAAEPVWAATEFARMIDEGEWRGELNVRHRDGTLIPVEARATVVALPTGPVYLSTLRDVSERHELDRLQGEFLAAVSHDLKNPLTTIRAQAQLLRRAPAATRSPNPRSWSPTSTSSWRVRRGWPRNSTSCRTWRGCARGIPSNSPTNRPICSC